VEEGVFFRKTRESLDNQQKILYNINNIDLGKEMAHRNHGR
jgi:hypothetical protein